MDYYAIAASIITGILSIGAVGLFIKKNLPKVIMWVTVITKAFNLIDDLLEAIEPDPTTGKIELTTAEIDKLKQDAINLKAQWNAVWAK